MSTVKLSRDERDALYAEIQLELCHGTLDDISDRLECGRGETIRDLRENAERAFRLFDDLGWDRVDRRPVYDLTMPADQLAIYARSRIAQTEGCLRDNTPAFAEIAEGGDPWRPYRDQMDSSIEDDVADLRRTVDRDLDVISACRSILRQLGHDS